MLRDRVFGLSGRDRFGSGPSTPTTRRWSRFQTLLDESASYPRTITDEVGRDRTFTYDPLGVLQSVTDLGGNAWTYAHTRVLGGDVRFDVFSGDVGVGVSEARAPVSQYAGRDPQRDEHRPVEVDAWVDRLARVTSPTGEVTSWTFAAGGQVARVDYPFGGALARTFGADLEVATEARPFGTTLTYARDTAGRVTQRTGDDASLLTFDYAPGDRVDHVGDATGTTTYVYDGAGRFGGLDYPSGLRFREDWDPLDRVTSIRAQGDPALDPAEHETRYTYDAAGNLATVTDPSGRVTTYTYDAANRLTDVVLPNGVHSSYGYDARSRVTSLVHATSSGTVLASVSYVRADSGEPTRITREDGSYVLVAYDAALRVERERYFDASDALVEEIAYTYDADGNRSSRTTSSGTETYVYASGARLLHIERGGAPVASYTYDGGGRVTRIERGVDAHTLSYDADDHVVAIADEVAATSTHFAFDAAGRRVAREERDAGGTPTAELRFATAPTLAAGLDSPHLVTDAAGAPVGGYVFDGEHPLARYDATGDATYYLRDAMGSVIGLVDGAGTGSARIHYDGFGNVRRTDGALAALPAGRGGDYRFQGMWLDPYAGLYYVRARTYEPQTGRFTTMDPRSGETERPEGFRPYTLNASNPLVFRDPSGLSDTTLVGQSVSVAVGLSMASVAQIAIRTLVIGGIGAAVLPDEAALSLAEGIVFAIRLAATITQLVLEVGTSPPSVLEGCELAAEDRISRVELDPHEGLRVPSTRSLYIAAYYCSELSSTIVGYPELGPQTVVVAARWGAAFPPRVPNVASIPGHKLTLGTWGF